MKFKFKNREICDAANRLAAVPHKNDKRKTQKLSISGDQVFLDHWRTKCRRLQDEKKALKRENEDLRKLVAELVRDGEFDDDDIAAALESIDSKRRQWNGPKLYVNGVGDIRDWLPSLIRNIDGININVKPGGGVSFTPHFREETRKGK